MHNRSADDFREANIKYTHKTWEIDAGKSAFVLVDFWTTHIIASHLERCGQIITTTIAPLLRVARDAGFTIIHAPGRGTAPKYHEHPGYMVEQPNDAASNERDGESPEAWPPKALRDRTGEYSGFRRTFLDKKSNRLAQKLSHSRKIPREVEPAPDDYIVVSGQQLHELLTDLRTCHLFYLGFATNDCVLYKDYGVRAMGNRGYNPVLLRDCTVGIEDSVGLHRMEATNAAIRFIELQHVSATASDFCVACANALAT